MRRAQGFSLLHYGMHLHEDSPHGVRLYAYSQQLASHDAASSRRSDTRRCKLLPCRCATEERCGWQSVRVCRAAPSQFRLWSCSQAGARGCQCSALSLVCSASGLPKVQLPCISTLTKTSCSQPD